MIMSRASFSSLGAGRRRSKPSASSCQNNRNNSAKALISATFTNEETWLRGVKMCAHDPQTVGFLNQLVRLQTPSWEASMQEATADRLRMVRCWLGESTACSSRSFSVLWSCDLETSQARDRGCVLSWAQGQHMSVCLSVCLYVCMYVLFYVSFTSCILIPFISPSLYIRSLPLHTPK